MDEVTFTMGAAQPHIVTAHQDVVGTKVLYWATGAYIMIWDVDHWDLTHKCAATVTDLISYNGTLFAACGYSTAYEYSTDGVTWVVSDNTGDDKFAHLCFWINKLRPQSR